MAMTGAQAKAKLSAQEFAAWQANKRAARAAVKAQYGGIIFREAKALQKAGVAPGSPQALQYLHGKSLKRYKPSIPGGPSTNGPNFLDPGTAGGGGGLGLIPSEGAQLSAIQSAGNSWLSNPWLIAGAIVLGGLYYLDYF